jgi:hypothetical protein
MGMYEGVSNSSRTKSITKYTLTTINTRWEATQSVITAKLTRLTDKIAIQLHLVAESCTICSSRSRRPVRKLLDTPSYTTLPNRNNALPIFGTTMHWSPDLVEQITTSHPLALSRSAGQNRRPSVTSYHFETWCSDLECSLEILDPFRWA